MSKPELGIDYIQHEPVTDIMFRWRRGIDRSEDSPSPFFMFYLAGPDEARQNALAELMGQLDIKPTDRVEFEIDARRLTMKSELFVFADDVRRLEGNRVMVVAKGFERLFVVEDRPTNYRVGHDWDQQIREEISVDQELKNKYREIGKQVVIVTTIGFSCGPAAYDRAVRSAVISQFKNGIIELMSS